MNPVIEFVKAVGVLGAVAVGLLIYYAAAVQGFALKALLEGDLTASDLMKTWPVLVAIVFFLGQFAWNRELSKLKGRSRMEEEAIAAAKDDKNFWATLDGHLRDRRALMHNDEPNYVSAVTDSAYLLRGNISKTLEKYPGVSGPMRNYALLLRDEIKDFLDQVEKIERRAGITLKGAGIDRRKLAELCQTREVAAHNGSTPCDTEFVNAHATWRANTQALVSTVAKLLELPAPNFGQY
jgi:hypothetical protein